MSVTIRTRVEQFETLRSWNNLSRDAFRDFIEKGRSRIQKPSKCPHEWAWLTYAENLLDVYTVLNTRGIEPLLHKRPAYPYHYLIQVMVVTSIVSRKAIHTQTIIDKMKRLRRTRDINEKDQHGITPFLLLVLIAPFDTLDTLYDSMAKLGASQKTQRFGKTVRQHAGRRIEKVRKGLRTYLRAYSGESYFRRIQNARRNTQYRPDLVPNNVRVNRYLAQYMRDITYRAPDRPREFTHVTSIYRGLSGVAASTLLRSRRLHDPGWISFSRSRDTAHEYATQNGNAPSVVLELRVLEVTRGTPWIWFSSSGINSRTIKPVYENEEEVLLPPGTLVIDGCLDAGPNTSVCDIEYIPDPLSRSLEQKRITSRRGHDKGVRTRTRKRYRS